VAALQELLDRAVAAGPVPGVVALVSGPGGAEVACAGVRTVGGEPMARDCLFRIASISKPILAAATLALHEQRRLGLDDPAQRWLPELAEPVVLRALDGPIEDVVPAVRPVTVRHLLTLQGGHGQPERCDAPIASVLTARLGEGPPRPAEHPEPVEWMRRLSGLPLLHQPGEGWTYNTGYDILGVLLARLTGAPLADVLTATVLEPMGMTDTGFWTRETDRLSPTTVAVRPGSSWWTHRTGSGRSLRGSRPGPAACSPASTTGRPSARCCWPAGSTAVAGSWRRSRYG
jgi:CubicO group peptidase (beta-lactamase class C family)